MSQVLQATPTPTISHSQVGRRSLGRRFLSRPEVGSLVGAVGVFVMFFAVAEPFRNAASLSNVLYASSTIGIMAVGVSLLMIGGEFDLSAGVGVITSSLVAAMFAFEFTTNVWVGVLFALVLSLGVGFVNGYVLVRTRLPSFLVTLATFLMLQGLNLAITKLITGNVATDNISDMDGFDSAKAVFASEIPVGDVSLKVTVAYWVLLVAIATWVLLRTRVGNWIFAVGGDADSARAVGVPVNRTKIGLFMAVGGTAWFLGMHNLFAFNVVLRQGEVDLNAARADLTLDDLTRHMAGGAELDALRHELDRIETPEMGTLQEVKT